LQILKTKKELAEQKHEQNGQNIFARVVPEQKMLLVTLLKKAVLTIA